MGFGGSILKGMARSATRALGTQAGRQLFKTVAAIGAAGAIGAGISSASRQHTRDTKSLNRMRARSRKKR